MHRQEKAKHRPQAPEARTLCAPTHVPRSSTKRTGPPAIAVRGSALRKQKASKHIADPCCTDIAPGSKRHAAVAAVTWK
eukprot:1857987-Rhodomonas_salina.1